MKKQKGITLIAMIITIIVMLILAGVSVNIGIGNNGILDNSEKAAENTKISEAKEFLIEAWGYVLGKYENVDEMENSEFNSKISPYFSNYMSSYGVATITARLKSKNSTDYAIEIKFKITGEEERIFYIVNDTNVYEEAEFKSNYTISNFNKNAI